MSKRETLCFGAFVAFCTVGDSAFAACNIPAGSVTPGASVECSGDFTNQTYSIPGVQNVTIVNTGNWSATGDLPLPGATSIIGPQIVGGDYTGLHVTNYGTLRWTEASDTDQTNVSQRIPSVLGSNYATLSRGSTYINHGTIIAETTATVLSSIAGIGNIGRSGVLYSENTGTIQMDVSRLAAGSGGGMVSYGGSDIDMVNSGTISVVAGPRYGSGMVSFFTSLFGYESGSVNMDNSGNIAVSATTGSVNGLEFYLTGSAPKLTDVTMTNTGQVQATTTSGTAAGFYVQSANASIPIRILNGGDVLSSGYSILAGAWNVAPIHALNTGTLQGDILTRAAADIYRQEDSGELIGSLNLGDGSDLAEFVSTDVSAVTLFDGGDDVSAADGMVDTLTFSGVVATLAGANIVNWENISIDSGTITISDGMLVTGQEDGIGLTLASGGTLDAGAAMTLTGNVTLEDGGTFEASGGGAGVYTITGNVTNAGLISSVDGVSGDQVRVTGLYTGTGGVVALDTTLGDDSSATDVLYLDGASAGSSYLRISNAGGTGAQTVEGIKIIEVGGASDGTFSLVGDYVHEGEQAVVGGAYAYKLYQGGKSTPTDGNWYLRSELITAEPEPEPLYQAGVPVYESYPQILLGLNGLPTLQQRIGNRIWTNGGGGSTDNAGAGSEVLLEHNGVWARIEGVHNAIKPNLSTANAEYDYNTFRLQAGVDGLLAENEAGALMGGIALHYTHGSARIRSVYDADSGKGRIGTDGFGLTGTLTWLGESGFYLDGQGQVTWYDSNLSIGGGSQSLVRGNDGFGYALSIEAGQRIAIDPAWSVTPQAQLVYSSIDFDDFTDAFGAPVGLERGDSLQGRLGIALEYGTSWQNAKGMQDRAHIYGIANLYHEFLDGTRVDVAGTNFSSKNDRWWGGLGIGGSYNWDDDKYSIYGEVVVKTSLNSFGDSYALGAQAGFRVRW